MIKKVPYTSNLISIGNSPHYNGQLVYSDGRVAYGWQYNVQQPTTGINRATAGLWVRAEHWVDYGNTFWCLMDENLNFENVPLRGLPEPSENVYNWYCYPWVCCTWTDWSDSECPYHGEMIYSDTVHYEFLGQVIRMGPGKILTYYDEYDDILGQYTHYWLCSYSNDGSVERTDLKQIQTDLDQFRVGYFDGFCNWYKISAGEEPHISMCITALDTDGGYVTVKTTDPDNPYLHFYCAEGTYTETDFPEQIILSDKAKLLLPSLDLIVNGVTYSNDKLQLLDYNSAYWWGGANVNGVHAYEDIVISQFSNAPYGSGYMFKNGTLYDYNSFFDSETNTGAIISPISCWSLAEIPGGQWYINYNPFE